MIIPSGPVWQRAAREKQWLLYRLVDKGPGRKPGKMPTLPDHPERSFDRATAACLTYAEAKRHAEALGIGYGLGVFDSQHMVVVDLDGVLTPPERPGDEPEWREDVLPHPELYLTGETYVEVSPSGTGLHILLPREGWPTATYDISNDPVGYHGAAVNFVAITLDHIEGPREVRPAPKLMAHLLPLLQQRIAEREREVQEASGQGDPETAWFPHLTAEERVDATRELLAHLPRPWVVERELWLKVTFALHGYPELFEVWDAWCKTGGAYDAAENEETWTRGDRGEGALTTVGTLIAVAREGGADLSRWSARGAAGRARGAAERLGERLGRVMPEAVAEAAQQAAEGVEQAARLMDLARSTLVLYVPSMSERGERWFDLRNPSTLSGKTSDMWSRQSVDGHFGRRTSVALRASSACMRTGVMPVLDPRLPYGFVPDEAGEVGEYPLGVVNALRMREVDEGASTDPKHPALALWAELLEQVFPVPRERVYVEQWVANKARCPWDRMVGLLSVARTHGTGRGIFLQVLRRLFGRDNVEELKVEDMFGATAQWNDWMTKLIVVVGEASDDEAMGIARHGSRRRKAYEQLKDMIDPGEKFVRRNIKGGQIGEVESFTSFLICTNHEDGLPIPRDDRRVTVVDGNEERASKAWDQRMRWMRDNPEALAVVWRHLVERVDMVGFEPDVALETSAKEIVIEAGQFPFDEELDDMLEALEWPLMVTHGLVERLASAHSENARSRAKEGLLGPAVERYLRANSRPLRGTEKTGARKVYFGGGHPRVRVLAKGEEGQARAVADAMENAQVLAWLEVLDKDILTVDLAKASGCRGMRKGMRVVK